jgi:hypothetical protein
MMYFLLFCGRVGFAGKVLEGVENVNRKSLWVDDSLAKEGG